MTKCELFDVHFCEAVYVNWFSAHTKPLLPHTGILRGALLRGVKERELSEATPECYSLYWFPIIRPLVPVESLVPGSNRQTEKETNTSHLQQHGEITLPPSGLEGQRGAEDERKRVRERVGASGRTSAMGQQMETATCRRRGRGKRWGFTEEQSWTNGRQTLITLFGGNIFYLLSF